MGNTLWTFFQQNYCRLTFSNTAEVLHRSATQLMEATHGSRTTDNAFMSITSVIYCRRHASRSHLNSVTAKLNVCPKILQISEATIGEIDKTECVMVVCVSK